MLVTELDETAVASGLDQAIDGARAALLSRQAEQGYWCGELQGDSILESEYIFMRYVLGQESDPCLVKIANYLRGLQQADGGWNLFPGGPPDLSGSVKAYFALKLMGDDPKSPHMIAARDCIRRMGGAEKCNSFTKFYLAALGQISYDACPSIPPEIVFLPKWSYFNLYHISSWTRVMILPLAVVTTFRPVRKVPPERGMGELYLDYAAGNRVGETSPGFPRSWKDFFLRLDQVLKAYSESPLPGLRQRAVARAMEWLLAHMENTEGLGAIFPSMCYMLIVLRVMGYADDHPLVARGHKELRDFFIEEGDTIRLQPCLSPVWDTGIAMHALAETNIAPEAEEVESSVRWLLEKECRGATGDWAKNCPHVDPATTSSWFFEYRNPHYPDVDDTAMVTMSLARLGGAVAAESVQRGVKWLLAMQNDDGGWAAFDRTTSRPILEQIPFADHNAMQDPSCPDITGRVLEGLGHCGLTTAHPAVARGIRFIASEQDRSGGWWGRWGVNFVYGTFQVLAGLRAVGQDMSVDFVRAAADWLRGCQKPDGSWGETPASYDDPSLKGVGPSTASQTAWGIMGIMAAAGADDPAVRRGIEWLIARQAADGAWDEPQYTGTGFPRVFYLKYHLYRLYFPLMALGRYRGFQGRG
ncbi:MAG TPA: squalene--hopene cyclase [Tepidisphaeraceae bacterium]|nr:squalene--hopene cyclase [Tepidisphaeraceae bacterium]